MIFKGYKHYIIIIQGTPWYIAEKVCNMYEKLLDE